MTTLPLYDPAPPYADGCHRVTAPGGYESWQLDAEDDAGDVRLVAVFSQGDPFDSGYLQRFNAYLRNPTRLPPPVPADFPSARFSLWEKGRPLASFQRRFTAEEFEAATEATEVRVGPHRLLAGAGGTLALTLAKSARTPRHLWAKRGEAIGEVSADLWFTPRFATLPVARPVLARDWSSADHHWVIANPLCSVSGTIHLSGAAQPAREIRFVGCGCHDHRFGSGPVNSKSVAWWMRGRLLGESGAEFFHLAVPRDASQPTELTMIDADAAGVRELAPRRDVSVRPSGVPESIDLGDGRALGNPTVLQRGPFNAYVIYDAMQKGNRIGTAFCEMGSGR